MSVLQGVKEVDVQRANIWKCGMRWAVEARRKQRRQQEQEQKQWRQDEQEQREQRQAEQRQNTGQEQSKQGKQVRFDEEEQLEEMRTEEDRYRADETRKGKGKGNGGKGEHEGKGGGVGSEGTQLVENLVIDEDQENMKAMKSEEEEEDHREDVRKLLEMMQKETRNRKSSGTEWAPNMGAGGSHTQAMSVPERRETRGMRWADCEDDERQEEEGERDRPDNAMQTLCTW